MKRMTSFLCLVVFTALFAGNGLPLLAQGSGLTFTVYGSSAPNRNTAENSPAWNAYRTWAGRALDSMENLGGNIGDPSTDPGAFVILKDVQPKHFIVSGQPAWLGEADPTGPFLNQYGNRTHFVFHVKGDGTVRFKNSDIF